MVCGGFLSVEGSDESNESGTSCFFFSFCFYISCRYHGSVLLSRFVWKQDFWSGSTYGCSLIVNS